MTDNEALIEKMAEAGWDREPLKSAGRSPWAEVPPSIQAPWMAAMRAALAVVQAERTAEVEALVPVVLRAMSIMRHGVEMVGPEPYEFTKDEVLDEAFAALEAVRSFLRVSEPFERTVGSTRDA